MSSLAFSILVVFSIFSLHYFSSVKGDADLIEQACEFAQYYNETCKSTLKSDPNSLKEDAPGLVAIMLNKAKAVAVDTQATIDRLLQSCSNADTRTVLTSCSEYFRRAATNIDGTLEALAAKDYYEAEDVGDRIEEVGGCDDYFIMYDQVEYPDEIYRNLYHLVDLADMSTNIITALKNNKLSEKQKKSTQGVSS